MKKNNFLIAALSIVAALSFSACNSNIDDSIVQSEETSQVSNNVNPEIYKIYQLYTAQGGDLSYEDWLESIKGEKGDQGEPGKDGLNGQDGHSSVVSIGDDGYWYIDGVNTGVKAQGEQGPKGEQGEKGDTGAQGSQGEKGDKGDAGAQGPKGDKGDQGLPGKDGQNGANGQNGQDGADGLTPYIGVNGNWWIGEQDTGVKAEGTNGQDGRNGVDGQNGKDGKDGVDGKNGKDGQDGLAPFIGANGNWWIGEQDTGVKAEGTNGQDGRNGIDGQNGKDGEDGVGILTGSGHPDATYPPINTMLPSGELYLDVSTGNLYKYVYTSFNYETGEYSSSWAFMGNIKGADGVDGLTPYIGLNGNWWIGEEDTGIKASGNNGQDGLNGADGQNGQNGTGIRTGNDHPDMVYPPTTPTIPEGELYLDLSTGNLYKYFYISPDVDNFAAMWDYVGNIKGADGADGVDGNSIVSVEKIAFNGNVDTYRIIFSNGTYFDYIVTNGINGQNGSNGKDGVDGKDGRDGIDGQNGTNGKDGVDGKDGRDGVDGQTTYSNTILPCSDGSYITTSAGSLQVGAQLGIYFYVKKTSEATCFYLDDVRYSFEYCSSSDEGEYIKYYYYVSMKENGYVIRMETQPKLYTITWKCESKTIATDYVKAGEMPEYSGDQLIVNLEGAYDSFITGWREEIVPAYENAVYNATVDYVVSSNPERAYDMRLNDDGSSYTICGIKYYGVDADVVIPSHYNGLPITGVDIRQMSIVYNSVTLPDTITDIYSPFNTNNIYFEGNIGQYLAIDNHEQTVNESARTYKLFIQGKELEDLIVPNYIEEIKENKFSRCESIKSVTIGSAVSKVATRAFEFCTNLDYVFFNEGAETIEEYAFSSCDIKQLILPDSCSLIDSTAFNGSLNKCNKIRIGANISNLDFLYTSSPTKAYIVSAANPSYASYNGAIYSKDYETLYKLPGSYDDSFYAIKDGCKRIDNYCSFIDYSTNLKSLYIPASLTNIGDWFRSSQNELEEYIVEDSNPVFYAYDGALYKHGYDKDVLESCPKGKSSIEISSEASQIGYMAFSYNKKITSLEIPDNIAYLGNNAFWYCDNLNSIELSNNITSISSETFYHCVSLESIVIPSNVDNISASAFSGCYSLVSVELPETVKTIGNNAFLNCYSLTTINIPDSVYWIGEGAFLYCNSLDLIKEYNNGYYIGSESNPYRMLYKVNDKLVSSFTFHEDCHDIGHEAFQGCEYLTTMTLPDSIRTIGEHAFKDCTQLATIDIPNSVTEINYGAFSNCGSLESIVIPDSVTYLGQNVFENCTSLTSVSLPDTLDAIEWYQFNGCTNLESIVIPHGVTAIYYYAFVNCTSLSSITFDGTKQEWYQITLYEGWNQNVPATVVHCSDGDIAI